MPKTIDLNERDAVICQTLADNLDRPIEEVVHGMVSFFLDRASMLEELSRPQFRKHGR
jgi:hypothetical protein